jgi:hypothetical protein
VIKLSVLGLLALLALLFIAPGATQAASTPNPLPPLIACPNVDGDTSVNGSNVGKVTVADILSVVQHFGKNFGQPGYGPLWDLVSPYNSTSPSGTGATNVADILYVVSKFGNLCSLMETQIAIATRAISDPAFSSTYCDDAGAIKFQNPVNCGGDPQFLTENSGFLLGKGYRTTGTDVPGQGVHYANFSLWDGTFNPARPEGLVYKSRAALGLSGSGPALLVAQLYYAEGDTVGWGPSRDSNKHAVNTDALCTPSGEPPGTGCGWAGSNDGWHWHENLCTIGIGTSNPQLNRMPTQQACTDWGASLGVTCTYPPTPGFTCNWNAAVGWMGHLWNWLPNANYTNAVDPGSLGLCQAAYCNTTEPNGRFADCFPDVQGWNAYNCPS